MTPTNVARPCPSCGATSGVSFDGASVSCTRCGPFTMVGQSRDLLGRAISGVNDFEVTRPTGGPITLAYTRVTGDRNIREKTWLDDAEARQLAAALEQAAGD